MDISLVTDSKTCLLSHVCHLAGVLLKAPVVTKAKTKESLSSWLNVFSHLDPLDNPDLLEGSANSKEEDDKQAC